MDLQNKMIKKGYIIPVIIAIIFAVLTVLFFKLFVNNAPYSQDTVELAVTDSATIIERNDIKKSDEISKSELGELEQNTLLGAVEVDDGWLSVVYNPSESVSADVISLNPEYKLVGETGVCLCTVTKNNSQKLKEIEDGDELKLSTIYSREDYTLTAVSSSYFTSAEEAASLAEDMPCAVVIVADTSNGISIGEKFLAVAFEVSGGAKVTA
ncbi:MAG: hypothetical protein IJ851_02660 [Eubacterium sp.]|nr:hypothetical protein [Eubacterium sp.]